MESLFELWGKRNPEWEKRYQDTIMNVFTDYGKGVNKYQDVRGKIYGAGYEIYIIAFFIGLYFKQRKRLVEDKEKRKVFGQAIMYWGNIEARGLRNAYGKIREYMFVALVARTDIDFLALDKGEITPRSVVDELIKTMEEYANFGFDYIQEKLEGDPNYFFKESAFLRVFTSFLTKEEEQEVVDDEPEDLNLGEDLADEEEATNKENTLSEPEQSSKNIHWSKTDLTLLYSYRKAGMSIEQLATFFSKPEENITKMLKEKGLS